MAAVFLVSGVAKLATPAATQGYIASIGMPEPIVAYLAAIVIELGGGMMLVLGYRVRYTSLALAAYCIVTGLMFHHDVGDQNQLFHLLKNSHFGMMVISGIGPPVITTSGR
jgi:putative oxidoreductase